MSTTKKTLTLDAACRAISSVSSSADAATAARTSALTALGPLSCEAPSPEASRASSSSRTSRTTTSSPATPTAHEHVSGSARSTPPSCRGRLFGWYRSLAHQRPRNRAARTGTRDGSASSSDFVLAGQVTRRSGQHFSPRCGAGKPEKLLWRASPPAMQNYAATG